MRKRIISAALLLALLLTLCPVSAAAIDADYGWDEMQGDIAMRVTQNGSEVTRLIVGETYQLQLWLQNIGPYAITVPLAWNASVVTIVDAATGVPVTSGRKNDGEATGFRAGSKCYESDYDIFTYEPLYWNGRPVYSANETANEAYPYIDQELGHYRICYYVNAPTAPLEAQLFLELNFQVTAKGDPDFHIATRSDGAGRYDPAEPDGLSVVLPDGDNGALYNSYGTTVECPEVEVMTQAEYDEAVKKPNSEIDQSGMGGGTSPTPQRPEKEKPEVMVTLVPAEHLNCFPYKTAVETAAVLKHINGQVTQESDCILPSNLITNAVNRLSDKRKRSLLVKMPEKIIPKDEYVLVFSLSPIDDMADSGLSMLYVETPWAYVGLNTAILANQTADSAEARLCVRPAGVDSSRLQVTLELDGKAVLGFNGPALRVILPYSYRPEGAAILLPTSGDVFGLSNAGAQPLSLYTLDEAGGTVIFLSPSFGYFQVETAELVQFGDLSSVPWAKDSIESLAQRRIVRGVGEGRFDPNASVTREQFATMLVTAFGMYSAVGENNFSDVSETGWYAYYVTSAAESGLVSGLGDGQFGTGRTITRQDLAVMAYRGLTQLGVTVPQTRALTVFADDGQIADYAKQAVYALYQAGILNGAEETLFAPNAPASRAQAARVLYGVLALTEGIL